MAAKERKKDTAALNVSHSLSVDGSQYYLEKPFDKDVKYNHGLVVKEHRPYVNQCMDILLKELKSHSVKKDVKLTRTGFDLSSDGMKEYEFDSCSDKNKLYAALCRHLACLATPDMK